MICFGGQLITGKEKWVSDIRILVEGDSYESKWNEEGFSSDERDWEFMENFFSVGTNFLKFENNRLVSNNSLRYIIVLIIEFQKSYSNICDIIRVCVIVLRKVS